MTMLIVEQGAAIQSQSNLIKVLLPDSRELWGMKGKAIANKQTAKAQDHSNTPSVQSPSNPAQGPSAQAGRQAHAQGHAGKAAKPPVQFPPIPASDLDPRRTVHTI